MAMFIPIYLRGNACPPSSAILQSFFFPLRPRLQSRLLHRVADLTPFNSFNDKASYSYPRPIYWLLTLHHHPHGNIISTIPVHSCSLCGAVILMDLSSSNIRSSYYPSTVARPNDGKAAHGSSQERDLNSFSNSLISPQGSRELPEYTQPHLHIMELDPFIFEVRGRSRKMLVLIPLTIMPWKRMR